MPPLAERRFTLADLLDFAALSGDANPMHIDPVLARRTAAGGAAVHGIFTVLWALDALAAARPGQAWQHLDVAFRRFVLVGDAVAVHIAAETADGIDLELRGPGGRTSTLEIGCSPPAPPAAMPAAAHRRDAWAPAPPMDLPFAALAGLGGEISPATAPATLAARFPNAAAALGENMVAGLAALSRLVGMVCPGLHSVFSSFVVSRAPGAGPCEVLRYVVSETDARFQTVRMAVAGLGLAGSVDACVRHPPVAQPDLAALRPLVRPGEFAGQRALVIGGSRGLGELTAKLLALGGAALVVTYALGAADAARVAAEITDAGGACTVMPFDATAPVAAQLGALARELTHGYYFATGKIAPQPQLLYDRAALARFLAIYADAFYDLCKHLAETNGRRIAMFYPSSVFVETRPRAMLEYAMAKAAGELLCADINRFMPRIAVLARRLPRLLTDQTASTVPTALPPPSDVLLPILREMHTA